MNYIVYKFILEYKLNKKFSHEDFTIIQTKIDSNNLEENKAKPYDQFIRKILILEALSRILVKAKRYKNAEENFTDAQELFNYAKEFCNLEISTLINLKAELDQEIKKSKEDFQNFHSKGDKKESEEIQILDEDTVPIVKKLENRQLITIRHKCSLKLVSSLLRLGKLLYQEKILIDQDDPILKQVFSEIIELKKENFCSTLILESKAKFLKAQILFDRKIYDLSEKECDSSIKFLLDERGVTDIGILKRLIFLVVLYQSFNELQKSKDMSNLL